MGGIGGKLVHPKGSRVPHKLFPSQNNVGSLVGDQSLHKVMFFGPLFGPNKGPGPPRAYLWGWGAPKMGSGVKHIKVRKSKTMQNPLVNAPNGAICCKLWPQTILGWGPQILGGNPSPQGRPLCPRGNPSALGANPLPLRQPLCPWGNHFPPGATPLQWGNPFAPGAIPSPWDTLAPGATPLPLGQPLCPLGNPSAPGATPLPQGL